jgi:hypothetical protein
MGLAAFDQYSLLHFATGVVAYFWGMPFATFFALHVLFEAVENTQWGMYAITRYVKAWPGGKYHADSLVNSVSDQFFASLGWIVSRYADEYYRE